MMGQLLDRLLEQAGLRRSLCYVTNAVKYRPPGNRKPWTFEVQASRLCLFSEISVVRPVTIVTLGMTAWSAFLPGRPDIGELTRWHHPDEDFSCRLLPLYHPSYVLRMGQYAEEDFTDGLRKLLI